MITLYVLGSGSRGNCFAVESEGVALLIDAGFSAREIERRAERAGLDLSQVAGIVLTHEHGDHACGAPLLARRLQVPVLTAPGTWRHLSATMEDAEHRALGLCARVELGPFTIEACPTSHDAAEPLAVVVRGSGGASVGVAYDLGRPTTAVRYLLRKLTAIVLEANHDEVQLRTSEYPPVVQRRIAGSAGHLSNRAAAELLVELHHPGLLRGRSGTPEPALQYSGGGPRHRCEGAPAGRFRGALHVADQDRPLPPILVVQKVGVQLALAL